MISRETTAVKCPLESVKAMKNILNETNKIKNSNGVIQCLKSRSTMSSIEAEMDSVTKSAVRSAKDMNA